MAKHSNLQKFDDQTIMFDIQDLMLGWRDTTIWLTDELFFVKENAANRLRQIEPAYLYSLLDYMKVPAQNFKQAMKKVEKYSRKTTYRRLKIRVHSFLLSFLLPFI